MTPLEISIFLLILFVLKCAFDGGLNKANPPALFVNLILALAAAVLLVFAVT